MERHLSNRIEALDSIKSVVLKSPYPDESLLEKILIHRELLSNKDIILDKDFYSRLESKVRAMPEMVAVIQKKEQIECVQINKKTLCPISQKEVVVPYIGECGHILEKKEAIKYLKSNPRAICPHIGCNKELAKKGRR